MGCVQYINEKNKESLNKPANCDQVYYSELKEWYTENAFRSFSIKYVLNGAIYYKLGKREHKVAKDNFLIATKQPDVIARFYSRDIVKSLCVDICEDSISDGLTSLINEQNSEITEYNVENLQYPNFTEFVYSLNGTALSNHLLKLSGMLMENPELIEQSSIGDDWFLEMVELIVMSEIKDKHLSNNLDYLKASTKKEILKRLTTGKEFMDENFLKNPDVKSVASESNMSVFHFHRCYKKVFGVSPYQYLLSKRLEHGKNLLDTKTLLVTDIAQECSFRDVFTFSKAFKKKYGTSPTKIIEN